MILGNLAVTPFYFSFKQKNLNENEVRKKARTENQPVAETLQFRNLPIFKYFTKNGDFQLCDPNI